jgi:16S rRNA (cytosine967-C5)-methyltransferase
LLYVVCSVFPEEGARQVAAFLSERRDARLLALPAAPAGGHTVQLVPSDKGAAADINILPSMHDGFFFALFEKH